MVVRHGFAIDEGLGDGSALGEFGFNPFGVHVAPETGHELVLLATAQVKETVFIEIAQVAAGPPFAGVHGFTQITQQVRALDQDFTILGQTHLHMGQRLATLPARWPCGRLRHTTEAHSDNP